MIADGSFVLASGDTMLCGKLPDPYQFEFGYQPESRSLAASAFSKRYSYLISYIDELVGLSGFMQLFWAYMLGRIMTHKNNP